MDLLNQLNEIAAEHGIGRIDLVENRLVGIKSRGAYETPGGTLLVTAHRELETLCVDRETAHYSETLSLRYAELVYYGAWFTPQREALGCLLQRSAEARDRAPWASSCTRATSPSRSASRPIRCIAKASPASP